MGFWTCNESATSYFDLVSACSFGIVSAIMTKRLVVCNHCGTSVPMGQLQVEEEGLNFKPGALPQLRAASFKTHNKNQQFI